MSTTIQADIEQQLAHVEPAVEVLLAEVVNGSVVRLFIDHPDGVTLALCERVTKHLAGVRETYALEVSVTVAADTGVVSIAYDDIHRSNLLGD